MTLMAAGVAGNRRQTLCETTITFIILQAPGAIERGRPEVVAIPVNHITGGVTDCAIDTLGGCIGLLVGLATGRFLQELYPEFPFHPPAWAIVAALGVSCSVGLIFGILPARNAARLDPVQALMRRKA